MAGSVTMRLRHRWYPPPRLISYRIANSGPDATPGVPISEPSTFSPIAAEDGTYYGGRRENTSLI